MENELTQELRRQVAALERRCAAAEEQLAREREAHAAERRELQESSRRREDELWRALSHERERSAAAADLTGPLTHLAKSLPSLLAHVAIPDALAAVMTAEERRRADLGLAEMRERERRLGPFAELFHMLVRGEPEARRAHMAREADAWRALMRARRPAVFGILQQRFLGRPAPTENNSLAAGAGLHQLWQEMRRVLPGVVDALDVAQLLRDERQIESLCFAVDGAEAPAEGTHHTLPADHVVLFVSEVVCKLPALHTLCLWSLPDVRQYCLPWCHSLPRSVTQLELQNSSYTADDVRRILDSCPQLRFLGVSQSHCADLRILYAIGGPSVRDEWGRSSCFGGRLVVFS